MKITTRSFAKTLFSLINENKKDIIEYFQKGSKSKQFWKIGTEHEKFLYDLNTLEPIDYSGKNGIKPLFKLLKKKGWKEVRVNSKKTKL